MIISVQNFLALLHSHSFDLEHLSIRLSGVQECCINFCSPKRYGFIPAASSSSVGKVPIVQPFGEKA